MESASSSFIYESTHSVVIPTETPLQKKKTEEPWEFSVSYVTMTYLTSGSMFVIPVLLCLYGCQIGAYECNFYTFPWVSDVMGDFPNDKTYVFLMNFFTAVQFFTFRAYYGKLKELTSDTVNNLMLFGANVSLICGPILAVFDRYPKRTDPSLEWASKMHKYGTLFFTLGSLLYILPMVTILNVNKKKFPEHATKISMLVGLRAFMAIFALICFTCHVYNVPGDWSKFTEWESFLTLFVHYILIAPIFKVRDSVIYDK